VIIGSTPLRSTWRELALVWGVVPILEDQPESDTAAVNLAIMGSISRGIVREGELLVITAGFPMGTPGTTNMLQLQVAGRILVNGIPYLKKEATGRIVKALTSAEALEKTREGDILVVRGTDKEYIPAVKKCAGLITEQSGLTSHPAILALEMRLPCVLGAQNAMEVLEDGMTVTIDGERGIVYQGNVRLRA
jgi:pyruvate kinase